MSRPIIEVENVSKRYKLGEFNVRTLGEEVEQFFRRLRRKNKEDGVAHALAESSEFWALKDVSFSVQPGEVVGIIGRNGAGKSTLLKILSRVTEPTSGEIRIRGRVASLLEVGSGFHPDLTGRENIYLNGTILGMTKAEVKAKFDEIVAFAETEKFLDTPVKRYSSGMYVRLAFAVAAHLEPEILIVDEVLAVGDAGFQKKCLGKMHNVSAKEGRTVLFVSHNMTAVASLCGRAILLTEGTISMSGAVKEVTNRYLAPMAERDEGLERVWRDIYSAPGNERIRIHRVTILQDTDKPYSPIEMGVAFRIIVEYWNLVEGTTLILNLVLFTTDGAPVFESVTTEDPDWSARPHQRGLFRSTCFVPGDLVNAGNFMIQLIFFDDKLLQLFDFTEAAIVSVHDTTPRSKLAYYGRFVGSIHPKLKWNTTLIGSEVVHKSTTLIK
jgi:lipopolysaccharide transport system ATP-binding protein